MFIAKVKGIGDSVYEHLGFRTIHLTNVGKKNTQFVEKR
jgi:hypothetical protein